MKVVAFLPVKGNSRRIENKNSKLLDGKPLFLHTLEKLVQYDFIDEVYLDSESSMIFDLASNIDCKLLKRDVALASNKTDGHALFFNEVSKVDADIYVQILCTSPFIKKETIEKGINILKNHDEYDSVVLIKKDKQYLWKDHQPLYNKKHIPNSIDLPDTIVETMGLYIVKKKVAHEKRMRYGEKVYLLEADPVEAIDINYSKDFELAAYIAAGMREKNTKLFKNLAQALSSPILSDILDDLNIKSVIKGLRLNIENKKILGRAKTIKLRKLKDKEDYKGIYDALYSYETIVPNDIILVENECSEYAYFGDLNANLAIKAGAIGAIIGGKTRDYRNVKALDFPVFSYGQNCKDVRKRATLESINKKITIEGVEILPGDLVFGDIDGVVVIPKKYEENILKKALETLRKEKDVLLNTLLDQTPIEILERIGEF
ncbi:MAG: cytidyltransferase [Marinisporobacter sp.]|jgi:regulator of RNase E activity RraA/CMP-N-acetylneuraminic acid synthetase|nr:cytidyltransferase [Marinisporobacter sp.]